MAVREVIRNKNKLRGWEAKRTGWEAGREEKAVLSENKLKIHIQ